VLLAEDEDEVRSASQRVLERLGYRVLAAVDGESALALYHQFAGDIRLVLSDVVMPRMNGPQLRAAIRREGGTVPILFASGYPARDLEAAAALSPETPLLRKPWTVDELAIAVREALAGVTDGT
jgi:CheY-like chemotaxis protein